MITKKSLASKLVTFLLLAVYVFTPALQSNWSSISSASSSPPAPTPLTWLNETTSAGPPNLAGHVMTFDMTDNRYFLFGGQSVYITLNDLWSLDPASYAWSKVNPQSPIPMGRADSMFTFVPSTTDSPKQDFLFLFGGWYNDTVGVVGRLADTWYFFPANNSWSQIATNEAPTPRSDSAVGFDPVRNLVLIYGGYNGTSYLSDTWGFHLANRTWTQVYPTNPMTPPPLADARMGYDERQNIFVMFGGNNNLAIGEKYNHYNTTWVFSISSHSWSRLSPALMPSDRDYAHFAYDPDYGIFLLHGGYDDERALNDTWLYSYATNTWAEIGPENSPPARFAGTIAYAPTTRTFVLYGGTANHKVFGDTWSFQYIPQTRVTIEGPNPIHADTLIQFSAQITSSLVAPKYYSWSFGDQATASEPSPFHRYSTPGNYRVSLNITDSLNQDFNSTLLITVTPSIARTADLALLAGSLLEVLIVFIGYKAYSWLREPTPPNQPHP